MNQLTPCDTKVLYDTEFEAERASAINGDKYKVEYKSYPCKNHWHITHVDREQRRGAGGNYWRCRNCRVIEPIKDQHKHICRVE